MRHKVYFEVTFEKNVSARSYFFFNTSENITVQKILKFLFKIYNKTWEEGWYCG